jgi:hypothetical protein
MRFAGVLLTRHGRATGIRGVHALSGAARRASRRTLTPHTEFEQAQYAGDVEAKLTAAFGGIL